MRRRTGPGLLLEEEWDNRHMPERLEVQRAVAASAGEIFATLGILARTVAPGKPRP
jgi:hypothetical protein